MYTATITKSGQVTIPKELRDFLGVKPGQRIIFQKSKDRVSIQQRMSDKDFLKKIDAIHEKYGSNTKSNIDAIDAVRALRDGKVESLNNEYREKFL